MRTLLALLVILPGFARAETEVDVELFLAVDVSRSMTARELEIQRRGYAEALMSDEVVAAIGKGALGRIALTYVEWAGRNDQRIVVPWSLIDGREEAPLAGTPPEVTLHSSVTPSCMSRTNTSMPDTEPGTRSSA